jgi:hypothetical protein
MGIVETSGRTETVRVLRTTFLAVGPCIMLEYIKDVSRATWPNSTLYNSVAAAQEVLDFV